MQKQAYLSLVPESLVISMLEPADFGTYLAAGTRKRAREQALYFELDLEKIPAVFNIESILDRCVPHEDRTPKHSVYASIYRVLERIPLEALGSLWLATQDGRTLELNPAATPTDFQDTFHLYQELAPVHPLIASNLNPVNFANFITKTDNPVSVPKICFVTLELAGLANDPRHGEATALPYKNIDHLRDCLTALKEDEKQSKTVDRIHPQHVHYRCIKDGFYIGDDDRLIYYPFPAKKELDEKHHNWWRSASLC